MNAFSEACYAVAGQDHELAENCRDEWLANPRFALAFGLLCEGFSVIPLLAETKVPARKWKKYQTERATVLDLVNWFANNDFIPAIVTGELSGITVIDCDSPDAVDAALEAGIESSLTQRTKRGIHFVFRWNGERNTVRVNGLEKVDRRGEGGYIRAYADSGSWTTESVLMCGAL